MTSHMKHHSDAGTEHQGQSGSTDRSEDRPEQSATPADADADPASQPGAPILTSEDDELFDEDAPR